MEADGYPNGGIEAAMKNMGKSELKALLQNIGFTSDDMQSIESVNVAEDEWKSNSLESNEELAMGAKYLGNKAFARGDFSKAAEHYTRSISLDSSHFIYFQNRAAALNKVSIGF
jgi:hypothetical protein